MILLIKGLEYLEKEFTNSICFIDFSFQIIIIVDEEVRECVALS